MAALSNGEVGNYSGPPDVRGLHCVSVSIMCLNFPKRFPNISRICFSNIMPDVTTLFIEFQRSLMSSLACNFVSHTWAVDTQRMYFFFHPPLVCLAFQVRMCRLKC
jgi:hypothetical protein